MIDKRALSPNRWSLAFAKRCCDARVGFPGLPLDAGVHRSETFILCNLGEREAASSGIKSRPSRDRADAGHALHAAK